MQLYSGQIIPDISVWCHILALGMQPQASSRLGQLLRGPEEDAPKSDGLLSDSATSRARPPSKPAQATQSWLPVRRRG